MIVILQYFRLSGKWYSEGEYKTSLTELWQIWNEVEVKLEEGKLPDLIEGAKEFIVLVDVPEHPHRHPHLIIHQNLFDVSEVVSQYKKLSNYLMDQINELENSSK